MTLLPKVEGFRLEASVFTVVPVMICVPPAEVGPPVGVPEAKVRSLLPMAFTDSVLPGVAPGATSAVMKK